MKRFQGCGNMDFSHLSMDKLGLIFYMSEAEVYLSNIETVNKYFAQVYCITFSLGIDYVKPIFHRKPVKIFQCYADDLF